MFTAPQKFVSYTPCTAVNLTHHSDRSIVHDDVKATESHTDLGKRVDDLLGLADVGLQYEETVGRVFAASSSRTDDLRAVATTISPS